MIKIEYPDLPIIAHKQKIIEAIKVHQVIIVAGETGSGKTTQLPKFLLEAGFAEEKMIGHTQPRRVAARTIANRIAEELHGHTGDLVGFKIRFSDKTSKATRIKIMTDGILLLETQTDSLLRQYDCLIIDEAHERSLNIDFLLGYIKTILPKRPDLKIIITSATIDLERFSQFFHDAPIITVEGRTYPVELNYVQSQKEDDLITQVVQAVKTAITRGTGDMLIFQSGEKEIREVIEALQENGIRDCILLPLYARQSASEQQKIFQSASKRKIIVTTNVAETSLTVPNIRFVIDAGTARINRYNYRTKLQRLLIEPISQASAEQRKGRCGRIGPGICYRLYSEEDLFTRPFFTTPEILRTHLAGVILKLLAIGIKDIEAFPFIDPPEYRHIKDGLMLLSRLGAIDDLQRITPIGRLLAQFPVDPKLGRVVIAANQWGALAEILIIASFLSIVDPRERPQDMQEKADAAHSKFQQPDSDYMTILTLWQFIYEKRQQLSERQFRKLCKENFLSFIRILEWFDVLDQLQTKSKELGFKLNQVPAEYAAIHQSLLYGFFDTIGTKIEKREYLGARNTKFLIHPSSGIANKPPLWVMAYEIIHTSQTFSRYNAAIDPKWLELVAKPFLKHQYFEPYFDPKRGCVFASEKVTLFGLEIIPRRRVLYDKIDPLKAREIFIQQGLVEGLLNSSSAFYKHNTQVIATLQGLENRIRKQHYLIQEERVYQFYNEHIPKTVYSEQTLRKWLLTVDDTVLQFTEESICDPELINEIYQKFPSELTINDQPFALSYHFDPQEIQDGVSLCVPFQALPSVRDADLSWGVDGLLEDKIEFYIRALPKRLRVLFVPLPETIKKAKLSLKPSQGTFQDALAQFLQQQSGMPITAKIWDNTEFPPFITMHVKVMKDNGTILFGNSLNLLYQENKEDLSHVYLDHFAEAKAFTAWEMDEIPQQRIIKKNNFETTYYCALTDKQTHVSLELFETQLEAELMHRQGLTRLYLFYLTEPIKHFKRNISSAQKKMFTNNLIDEMLLNSAYQLLVQGESDIRTRKKFEQQLALKRAQFLSVANKVLQLITQILPLRQQVQHLLEKLSARATKGNAYIIQDLQQQLDQLFTSGFVQNTPWRWLSRYPVYLKAIELRLQKHEQQLAKDKEAQLDIDFVQKAYLKKRPTQLILLQDAENPWVSFRWKVEELRVSLFAQSLGTIEVVSKVRLLKLLEKMD